MSILYDLNVIFLIISYSCCCVSSIAYRYINEFLSTPTKNVPESIDVMQFDILLCLQMVHRSAGHSLCPNLIVAFLRRTVINLFLSDCHGISSVLDVTFSAA